MLHGRAVEPPTIEDVVVVPHHHCRDSRHRISCIKIRLGVPPVTPRIWQPTIGIEPEIVGLDLFLQRRAYLERQLLLARQSDPFLEGLHILPNRVKVNLVAPHQQQLEPLQALVMNSSFVPKLFLVQHVTCSTQVTVMIADQVSPYGVFRAHQLAHPTRVRKAIARDVGHSWGIVSTGNGELPLRPFLPYTKLYCSLLRLLITAQVVTKDGFFRTLQQNLRRRTSLAVNRKNRKCGASYNSD